MKQIKPKIFVFLIVIYYSIEVLVLVPVDTIVTFSCQRVVFVVSKARDVLLLSGFG